MWNLKKKMRNFNHLKSAVREMELGEKDVWNFNFMGYELKTVQLQGNRPLDD